MIDVLEELVLDGQLGLEADLELLARQQAGHTVSYPITTERHERGPLATCRADRCGWTATGNACPRRARAHAETTGHPVVVVRQSLTKYAVVTEHQGAGIA